jgi:hypothetical protein
VLRIAGGVDSVAVGVSVVGKPVGSDPLSDYAVDRFDTVYVLWVAGMFYAVGSVLNNPQ